MSNKFLIHIFYDRKNSYSKPFQTDHVFLSEDALLAEAVENHAITAEEAKHVDLVEVVDIQTYAKCGGK